MRRHAAEKREILPDPKYRDVWVAKFINCLMRGGKKSVAQSIVYDAIEDIKKENSGDANYEQPLEVFKKAVENVMPKVEVRSKRIGGANYQVPHEVKAPRRLRLAIRWLINAALSRPEKTMRERLYREIMDAYNNKGNAIKKKEDTRKMAEANRAYAHFA